MQETLQHKEAFEYYYALGEARNLIAVSVQFKFSERSVAKWSKEFNWQHRIEQRDIEIGKKLIAKTNTTVLNEKAKYRSKIRYAIDSMADIKVESVQDYERLVKLDLLLMGEATDRTEHDDISKLSDVELEEELKKYKG